MMTIGHSTLSIEAFLRALGESAVDVLVDVRSRPGSRRHPQFGQEALFGSLREVGIEPVWRKGLGGWREARKDSINTGWRVNSFRGYADYMQTAEFQSEIEWLLAQTKPFAVMCAEAVPWNCHRSLIADAMLARGVSVEHILVTPAGASSRKPHEMTRFALVEGERVWYPAENGELFSGMLGAGDKDE
jgi:uncharacterized protein (DUF488 family)